ncbi:MAG: polysaccharide deacetylase [Lachnospiraceae bacterium]|nr:polysaccharide deacetylase [Lachnospiraceae bacterium]MDD7627923.1 polysaccharide deacetylase [Lachnospiraceae bacterium]MDY4119704.1 polysaccharide deacetylase family protein [Lachnospiraceae bacterium]
MDETAAHRKRIRRLKKMILGSVAMAILIPTIICIILGVRVAVLSDKTRELTAQLEEERNKPEEVTGVFSTAYVEESKREEEIEVLSQEEEPEVTESIRKIYLTFDDGPSSSTNEILDILKSYDVKATFFVVGKTDEASKEAYRRIVAEGHTLGMHSYSHKYDEIYRSEESFQEDLSKLQEYLYEVTGVWSRYYRFPGGSSNTVSRTDMQALITWLNENDITYYDWNVASGDAVSGLLSKDTIVNNCLSGVFNQPDSMILMHDASDKRTTVEALPEIISRIRMKGDVSFLAITDETVPIQHVKEKTTQDN